MTFFLLVNLGVVHVQLRRPHPGTDYFNLIGVMPLFLMGQYLIWGRFLHQRWKKSRTYYALTNRRALIVVGKGHGGRSSTSAYFDILSTIDKRVRADGNGSISFGGRVRPVWRFGNGRSRSSPRHPSYPTFEDVDDAELVYAIAVKLHRQVEAGKVKSPADGIRFALLDPEA